MSLIRERFRIVCAPSWSNMTELTMYSTACIITAFMCVMTIPCSFAARYGHWNPNQRSEFHPYPFPKRKPKDIDATINYQGWSYAGRGEFPWLVEIRSNDTEDFTDQENWANGNLVTSKFILTVCYAVVNVKEYVTGDFPRNDPLFKIGTHTFLTPKNPKFYKVLYSDDYTYKTVGNGFYTGTRQVKRFIPHPKCNQFELDYQWGMVEVKRPIFPAPPWTSYMPVDFQPEAFSEIKKAYTKTKLKLEDAGRCEVGLWGRLVKTELTLEAHEGIEVKREYRNDKVWNYKVKYSVVNADVEACWKIPGIDVLPRYVRVGETIEEWECMALNGNETLGTVCNHDRGAPIVCDGYVRAIVLAGATEQHCNLTNPLPFLVMDIRYAYNMLAEISQVAWNLAGLKHYGRVLAD